MPDGIDWLKPCPHGHLLPGDVTLPLHPTLGQWISVGYGLMPFLVIFLGFVDTVVTAVTLRGLGTREMSFMGFVLLVTGLNEYVLKRIAHDPRPDLSCNHSCGFPSGHSVSAIAFYTLMFLDASFRVSPKIPMSVEVARRELQALHSLPKQGTFLGMSLHEWLTKDLRACTLMPLSANDVLDAWDFVNFVLQWSVLLLPVPLSRVVVKDHTSNQVLIGSLTGIVEAILWFTFLRRVVQLKLNNRLGSRIFCVFVHNYAKPRFEVLSDCYRELATVENITDADSSRLEQLVGKHRELQWYLRMVQKRRRCATRRDAMYRDIVADVLQDLQCRLQTVINAAPPEVLEELNWPDASESSDSE